MQDKIRIFSWRTKPFPRKRAPLLLLYEKSTSLVALKRIVRLHIVTYSYFSNCLLAPAFEKAECESIFARLISVSIGGVFLSTDKKWIITNIERQQWRNRSCAPSSWAHCWRCSCLRGDLVVLSGLDLFDIFRIYLFNVYLISYKLEIWWFW